jgi:hypothetical protein
VAVLTRPRRPELSTHGRSLLVGLALAGIVALGLAFRAGALDLPLDRDEGGHGYIGANLTSGILPYRDAFDNKPPGVYLFYAAASIGPDRVTSVRLATDVLFVGSIFLVFAITARLYGRTAGLAAALAMAVLGNSFRAEAARANTEQIMVPIMLLALWSLQKGIDRSSLRWLALSGFAGGAAVLLKPVAVPPQLVLLGFLGLRAACERRLGRSAAELGTVAGGMALPILATAIFFGALGLLDDLYYWVFSFNSEYVRAYWEAGSVRLDNFDPILSPWAYVALGFLFSYPFFKRQDRAWDILIIAWTMANLAGAKMGLRDFPHYFVPVLPGIAMLSGAYISLLSHRLVELFRGSSWLRPALAAAIALGLFAWQADDYADFYFRSSPTEMARAEFGQQGELVFARAEEVASYVRASTKPGEEIIVWANEPEVYFLSERRSASRYIYISHFAIIPDRMAILRSDLLTRRPRLVVAYTEDSPMYKPFRAGLYELLDSEGYREEMRAGWLAVYIRSGSPTP